MNFHRSRIWLGVAFAAAAVPAFAQGTNVGFGGIRGDPTLPVEIQAETFVVDQTDGSATFTGNVVIAQGEMRLGAAEVRVDYAEGDQSRIEKLTATGGVTLVSGQDAAEAARAEYTIDGGTVVMTGDVLLTQGPNTMTGEKLTVDLKTGTGRMEGGVKTVLQPGGN